MTLASIWKKMLRPEHRDGQQQYVHATGYSRSSTDDKYHLRIYINHETKIRFLKQVMFQGQGMRDSYKEQVRH